MGQDFVQLALTSSRAGFVRAVPWPLIVSDGTLPRPGGSMRTAPVDKLEFLTTQDSAPAHGDKGRVFMALPVRKVVDTFPNMISVGRTANNDLVVPDASVSKFHAFFTLPEKTPPGSSVRFELSDAGSKNGTWVAGVALAPRGAPLPVKLGDRLRFGRIEFTVVDSGACWDTIDRMRR